MAEYRFVYNKIVSWKEEAYLAGEKSLSYMQGRKIWKERLDAEFTWLRVPPHTIYGAMMDACKDYASTVKKRIRGQKCDLPRCKKRTQRSFYCLGNRITPKGFYTRILGTMRAAEPLPNQPSDSRVIKEAGRWYLSIPMQVQKLVADNQSRVCAVDPGVRTFATVFSFDGFTKLGAGSFARIVRLCHYLDDLISRMVKAPCHRKQKMKMAISRMRVKIRRLVHEAHYRTLGWLFRNYDTVVIPECNFTSAISKIGRKIRRKTVRSLLGWAFGLFRNRAIAKAQKSGKNLIICNEAFTSKTANWTGEIVHNLGGRKVIRSQGVAFDRDCNGALGIFLKALLAQPVEIYRNY